MATLVALVTTFQVGAIAGTVYLALGGSATMALVYAGVAFVIASIVIWGWLFLELHRIKRPACDPVPPQRLDLHRLVLRLLPWQAGWS